MWCRGIRAVLGATWALVLLAGCLPAGSEAADPPEPEPGASVQVVTTEDALRYEATVLLPDPCYVVVDDGVEAMIDTTLSVTRSLVREPGICATVITPRLVSGSIALPPGGASRFELRLRDAKGRILSTVATDL